MSACRTCGEPAVEGGPTRGMYARLCRGCLQTTAAGWSAKVRAHWSGRREGTNPPAPLTVGLPPGWQACLGCEIGVEAPRTVCGACEAEARGERIHAAPLPTRHGDGGIPVIWEARRKTRRTPDELQIAGHGSGG